MLAATAPAASTQLGSGDTRLPASSTARAWDISHVGWDIEVYADIVRGALGASEAVCVFASKVTFRHRIPLEKVEVREAGCRYRKLDDLRSSARLYRVDPTAWEGVAASGRIDTYVWRDVYRFRGPDGWQHVRGTESRSRARVALRWLGARSEPGPSWWAPGVTPMLYPPVCVLYGPPFVGPCLPVKAGMTRPATAEGTIAFERLGSVPVRIGSLGAMSLHWDPIGYSHG